MNPFLSNEVSGEHVRDLREEAARASRWSRKASAVKSDRSEELVVRRFAERDIDGIRRLAALDEKPAPTGSVLVAEVSGELVAALPLDGGVAIADPFKPTADVVEVLQTRARQLREVSGAPARTLWLRGRAPVRKAA